MDARSKKLELFLAVPWATLHFSPALMHPNLYMYIGPLSMNQFSYYCIQLNPFTLLFSKKDITQKQPEEKYFN